ncbi:MAG: SUF system Fe-S cluster assembly regulator [Acidobacteriota bacterium]
MLRLSKETDYGIVILTYLAGRLDDLPSSAREVADEVNLSLPMVKKVLKELMRSGLLDSHRGVHGGYRLARRADSISVADIIGSLEGPMGLTECTGKAPDDCNIGDVCQVRGNWELVNRAIWQALEKITLAHMASSVPRPLLTRVGGTPVWAAGTFPRR